MSTVCVFHDRELERDGIFAGNCMECLEEAAVKSAENMGIPYYYYCGYCGSKCDREELIEHTTSKRCMIKLVKT